MDTSETYIKMCEQAEDILPYHSIEAEDFLGNSKTRKESVWLPRQDQLQEMLGFHSNEAMLFMFHEFTCTPVHNVVNFVWHHHKSMEQLWLAFVMKQHNKTWDGEKWCKEDD